MNPGTLRSPAQTNGVAGALDRHSSPWHTAARRIVQSGLWCVIEVRAGGRDAVWEPRWLICLADEEAILGAVADWISTPTLGEIRLAGYTRDTLPRDERAPTALIQRLACPRPPSPGS
jgi:hypothetical protein